MKTEIKHILESYAARMSGDSEGKSGLECAQLQGWIDADGNVTKDGREAAKAFQEQEKTRSVFRIG